MPKLRTKRVLVTVIVISIVIFEIFNVFPPTIVLTPSSKKPIILYYEFGFPPLKISEFPEVVNFTLDHGFNTLMMVVFTNHQAKFNKSTIQYFASYSESRGLKFVPSYYIESTSDQINVSGFSWVNLDMESLNLPQQSVFYHKIAGIVPFVSVTSPYGQYVGYHTQMNIIETYASSPLFWLAQLGYYHPGKICSVGDWLLHSQREYNTQINYCLRYSDGVMVFDYYNLLRAGFN